MAVAITQGDLLEQNVDAVVNTVNCVGVMGKGIALQFKRKWPANFKAYQVACRKGTVTPGKMLVFDVGELLRPRYIINFPTKVHWRGRSSLEFIHAGLDDLVQQVKSLGIRSIAVPPLGCGNGGLDWTEVRPIIEGAFKAVPEVEVRLFPPGDDSTVRQLVPPESVPKMTSSRAAMVAVIAAYRELGYPLSRLEVQKLAYFLECAGEPLGLSFACHTLGPYSDKLRHVLTAMDGTYITGVGDQSGRSEIRVVPNALQAAQALLHANQAETLSRVDRVAATIDGFQTPYGMELLATVHWAALDGEPATSLDEVVTRVHSWSDRKRQLMSEHDIKVAWERLREYDWL